MEPGAVMLAQPGVELLHRGVLQDAELSVVLILPEQLAERAGREQPPLVVVPWVQGDHSDPRERPVGSCRAAWCQDDDALRPYVQALQDVEHELKGRSCFRGLVRQEHARLGVRERSQEALLPAREPLLGSNREPGHVTPPQRREALLHERSEIRAGAARCDHHHRPVRLRVRRCEPLREREHIVMREVLVPERSRQRQPALPEVLREGGSR